MSHPPLAIVTGASRGLGLALTAAFLGRGAEVVAIARRPTVASPVPAGRGTLHVWQADLSDATPVAERLEAWLRAWAAQQAADAARREVVLINNAGVVSQPAPLHRVEAADLVNALRVGLEAPMLLSAAFLRATSGWSGVRKVVLVSSGLGRRAMAGSASYCAAKAGMDHLARALALEQAAEPNGARVVSLAPGIIDTDMQARLRDADPALFPERERFAGFKSGGQLDSPEAAAARLLACLERPGFGSQPVGDVREPA